MNVTLNDFDQLVVAMKDCRESQTFKYCGTTVTIDNDRDLMIKFTNDYGALCTIHGNLDGYDVFLFADGCEVQLENEMLTAKPNKKPLPV